MRRNRSTTEDGFTLIELMVVVLVIAVLLAIAIPTFLGARERAHDRAAQSNARNVLTVESVFFSDSATFTDGITALKAVDSSFEYTHLPALMTPDKVYVKVSSTETDDDTVIVGAKSQSGRCYWLRTIGGLNRPRFATTACNSAAAVDVPSTFVAGWE